MKEVMVEVRGDGVHVRWHDRDGVTKGERNHEIVVKVGIDDFDGEVLMDKKVGARIQAFAVTMASSDDPKRTQKRQEKALTSPNPEGYDHVVRKIIAELRARQTWKLGSVRDSLRRSVIEAYEHLSYEEVESIVKAALAEHILRS